MKMLEEDPASPITVAVRIWGLNWELNCEGPLLKTEHKLAQSQMAYLSLEIVRYLS